MNQTAEFQFLQNLCIPTMIDALKTALAPDNNDFCLRNASLNFSEGQLADFATDVLMDELQFDIKNLAENDPATSNVGNKISYVWDAYKGLKAIMYYRIAHHLIDFANNGLISTSTSALSSKEDTEIVKDYLRLQARIISERAASETTIEINPSAIIGKGFVIDHGVGTKVSPDNTLFSTVIGETCIIGDNCTLLNSVLLGAAVINEASSNKEGVSTGKRHPTLGNNVTVCAGVRILGNITIGNNVTIGPCCVITNSVPDDYYVTIVNQLQYARPSQKNGKRHESKKPEIHGLTIDNDGYLHLFGLRLLGCSLSVVTDDAHREQEHLPFRIIIGYQDNNSIRFLIEQDSASDNREARHYSLRIITDEYEYILNNSPVLKNHILSLIK